MFSANILSIMFAGYFFWRHNAYCESGGKLPFTPFSSVNFNNVDNFCDRLELVFV